MLRMKFLKGRLIISYCVIIPYISLLFSCHPHHKRFSAWNDFGLISSISGRASVDSSLTTVNQILKDKGVRLSGDWSVYQPDKSDITVLFVRPEGLPNGTIAQSDVVNKVIFISSDWKVQARKIFGDYSRLVSSFLTLTVVLLHETGHIVKYNVPIQSYITIDSLRLAHPDQMIHELYADIYASNAIKSSKQPVAIKLRDQLFLLEQIVDANYDFEYGQGATILSDMARDHNKRYKDNGYDHPNLNLRLAFMNYFLLPSKEKLALIQYICDQRKLSYPVPGPIHYLKLLKDS